MQEEAIRPDGRSLGRAVREIRARRGLSQEGVELAGGPHRNFVGAIERGQTNPTFRVLVRLAYGLGVPLSELMALAELRAGEGG